ncbi:hypothetical protein RDV89_01940 [Nocardioides zeae]|uniref:Uncharacterized protein n=1 Tax=Nocardioides imazamoxiresistens TaxID=3231893 RepID=A0ABU3PRG5_9ACTN|nr:hypothetical protein [Nocardioides zeae]MDT9591812.1 hypothetical protein [Nocardioides zeae]
MPFLRAPREPYRRGFYIGHLVAGALLLVGPVTRLLFMDRSRTMLVIDIVLLIPILAFYGTIAVRWRLQIRDERGVRP